MVASPSQSFNYEDTWFPDSSATNHLTPDSSNLMTKTEYTGNTKILMGNGSSIDIDHIGSSSLMANDDSTVLTLSQLLHAPHISKNLMSVHKFAKDNNVYFEFHPNSCCFKSQVNNKLLLEGYARNGLYVFRNINFLPSTHCDDITHVVNNTVTYSPHLSFFVTIKV
jgi:histone deacetylase 1/2